MLPPDIKSIIRDSKNDIIHTVFAYRKLTKDETVEVIGSMLGQKRVKPKRGQRFYFMTTIK